MRIVREDHIEQKFGITRLKSILGGEAADWSVGGTVDVTVGEAVEVTAGESVVWRLMVEQM